MEQPHHEPCRVAARILHRIQQRPRVPDAQRLAHRRGPLHAQRVHRPQRRAEHLAIEEGDGVEGLVLRRRRHIAPRQPRQERLRLALARPRLRHLRDRPDIRPGPGRVRFFSRIAEVLPAADFTELLEDFRCFHVAPVV